MKLTIACLLLSSSVMAQSNLNSLLAFEGSHVELNNRVLVEEKSPTFQAKYYKHKIYFTTEFGTDNRAVIDVYNISGDFIMSIQVKSNSPDIKQFIWNDYKKLQYKLKSGSYKAICRMKGKENKEVTFKIN